MWVRAVWVRTRVGQGPCVSEPRGSGPMGWSRNISRRQPLSCPWLPWPPPLAAPAFLCPVLTGAARPLAPPAGLRPPSRLFTPSRLLPSQQLSLTASGPAMPLWPSTLGPHGTGAVYGHPQPQPGPRPLPFLCLSRVVWLRSAGLEAPGRMRMCREGSQAATASLPAPSKDGVAQSLFGGLPAPPPQRVCPPPVEGGGGRSGAERRRVSREVPGQRAGPELGGLGRRPP